MSFSSNIIILGASGALALPILRLIFRNKKIATNIDGIEWKRDKWGFFEKIILKLSEFIACYSSDVIISDNKEIKNYIDKKYNIKSIYIPYGGNHVKNPKVNSNLIKFKSKDYAVKVCRIEPENNVEMVLEAFCKINHRNLVVIGNWSNSNYGKKLYNLYNNYRNIELLNPIYNQIELNKIRFNSNLYVHCQSEGGTNPSLVEAMFLDIPIICYDVKFNKYSTKNKALYFHDSKSLIKLLNSNFDLNSSIIASDLKKIAENEYIWKKISKSYIKILKNN